MLKKKGRPGRFTFGRIFTEYGLHVGMAEKMAEFPNSESMKKSVFPAAVIGCLLSLILFAAACKGEKKESPNQEPNRMEVVLAVHDEVMPRMSEIGRLVARLKPLADSTEAGLPYLKAMKDLQEAHQAMMDWMKGFGDRFEYAEIKEGKALSAQKQEWLVEEEVKVRAMRDQVVESISAAEALLDRRDP